VSAAAPELAGLSDDQLAEMFASGDETAQAAILAECGRQDEEAGSARRRKAWRASPAGQRYAAADAAWTDASHSEYLQAETACRGRLLAPGAPAGREAWPWLWTCSEREFDRWASEELKRWREFDAASFTRRPDFMRAASRPRAGEHPWHEPSAQQAPAAAPVQPQPAEARPSYGARLAGVPEAQWQARLASADEILGRAASRAAEVAPGAVVVRPPSAVAAAGITPRRPEVDGARLLEQCGLYLLDYASFPSPAAAVAVTLWAAHAQARDADRQLVWRASPRLLLTSAEQGSGKSTVLDLLAPLTQSRAGRIGTVTAPGLAQLLGRMREPALIDEAQLMFGTGRRSEMVRLIINSGYTRNGHALTGREGKASLTPVFGAVALAGLDSLITDTGGRLTDTLARCAPVVRMTRPSRRMPEMDERADARGERLGAALAAWTGAAQDQLRRTALDLADAAAAGDDGLDVIADGGRQAQLWRPLVAVADVAGGMWPAAVREACLELAGAAGDLQAAADTVADLDEADSRSFFDAAWGAQ
jgi:Protein of unknown function (DUF3631)